MVKWYNATLPRLSRGFDYPWPHKESPLLGAFDCGQEKGVYTPFVVTETAGTM